MIFSSTNLTSDIERVDWKCNHAILNRPLFNYIIYHSYSLIGYRIVFNVLFSTW